MIDSHIHLSCKCYNQTFPYIDYDGKELTIAADGRREALIEGGSEEPGGSGQRSFRFE